jgi:hypothetical protein
MSQQQPGRVDRAARTGGLLATLVDRLGLVRGVALLGQPSLQPGQDV